MRKRSGVIVSGVAILFIIVIIAYYQVPRVEEFIDANNALATFLGLMFALLGILIAIPSSWYTSKSEEEKVGTGSYPEFEVKGEYKTEGQDHAEIIISIRNVGLITRDISYKIEIPSTMFEVFESQDSSYLVDDLNGKTRVIYKTEKELVSGDTRRLVIEARRKIKANAELEIEIPYLNGKFKKRFTIEFRPIPEKSFFVASTGELNCIVVVEEKKVVATSKLRASIEGLFLKTKELSLQDKSYKAALQNVPIGKPITITPEKLSSLWFFDDWQNARYGNANGQFDVWETHEEIQIQLDAEKLAASENEARRLIFLGINQISPQDIPGLIYRCVKIRIPPQLEVICGVHNQPGMAEFKIPQPSILRREILPQFILLGRLRTVVSAERIVDVNTRTKKEGNMANHPFLITGQPTFQTHQKICRDESHCIGGYEILLKDIDLGARKIMLQITDPDGDPYNVWLPYTTEGDLVEIPENQKSVNIPNAIVFLVPEGYRDENCDYIYLFSIPVFMVQALDVFCGVSGVNEALINVYALTDSTSFYDHECFPIIIESNCYDMVIDVQSHGESLSLLKSRSGIGSGANEDHYRIPKEFDDETELYEISLRLMDTVEIARVFQGPLNYFRIEIDRFNPQEDSVDLTVIQDIPCGSYTKIQSSLPESIDIVRLDSEVGHAEKKNYNMILIGTVESNSLIRDLVESGTTPSDGSTADWPESIEADHKFYRNPFGTNKDIWVISGNDPTACDGLVYELAERIRLEMRNIPPHG